LQTPSGARESYDILANFPFSSTRKRMGIVLRSQQTGQISFHLKGADVIMKTKVNILQSDFIMEQCDNLAREGLRTLVITSKDIEKEEFDKW